MSYLFYNIYSRINVLFLPFKNVPPNLFFRQIDKEDKEVNNEFIIGKQLSMILEASKERNSNSSSGITSPDSITKLEQQSIIDFGNFLAN